MNSNSPFNSMNQKLIGSEFKPNVENQGWVTPDWMKDVDVKNTSGSTAGAGSGEFHQYRYQRRKELWRISAMESEARRDKERKDYENMKAVKEEVATSKTAKKAAKRKKRKDKKKDKKKPKTNTEESDEEEEESDTEKNKDKKSTDISIDSTTTDSTEQ